MGSGDLVEDCRQWDCQEGRVSVHEAWEDVPTDHGLRLLEYFYPTLGLVWVEEQQTAVVGPGDVRRLKRLELATDPVEVSVQLFCNFPLCLSIGSIVFGFSFDWKALMFRKKFLLASSIPGDSSSGSAGICPFSFLSTHL